MTGNRKFVDSPLEEDGFELVVRGRGELGLSPLFSRPVAWTAGAVVAGNRGSARLSRELPKRSTIIPNHGWILLGRTHAPDAGGRERQMVRLRSERGQSIGDGVGHQPIGMIAPSPAPLTLSGLLGDRRFSSAIARIFG